MSAKLTKMDQYIILRSNRQLKEYLPETDLYNQGNVLDYLNRFQEIFIKHNTSGQGRGVFKLWKTYNGSIHINGFTLHGKAIEEKFQTVQELHQFLNPFLWKGIEYDYIIQESIKSQDSKGNSLCFRVHVQKMKDGWIVGGMRGEVTTKETKGSGIVNRNRGTVTFSACELLEDTLGYDQKTSQRILARLNEVAILTAKTIERKYPNREYGIDFGIVDGIPKIFEVNTTPSIVGFSLLKDMSIWNQIVANRKAQAEFERKGERL